MAKIEGTVWRLGDNIDTDAIIPARYLALPSLAEMSKHLFEPLGEEGLNRPAAEPVIVAGENFGCGSSREHAVRVILEAGVKVVVADSLARIFFRNAINCGLAVVECPGISRRVRGGERLAVDTQAGKVCLEGGEVLDCLTLPDFLLEIVNAGGLIPYLKKSSFQET